MGKDHNSEYDKGYAEGYLEGFRNGLSTGIQNTKNIPEQKPYAFKVGCSLCGIGENGEPFGVRCRHPDCPMNL